MARVGKLRTTQTGLLFWCPGCKTAHGVATGQNGWRWNGNYEKPVFHPSVLVQTGHYAMGYRKGSECWCTHNATRVANGEQPLSFACRICHCFVGGADGSKPGFIEYLSDCTHELAGETVALPNYPWDSFNEGGAKP